MRPARLFPFATRQRTGPAGPLALTAVALFTVVALTQGRAPRQTEGSAGPGIWAVVRPSSYVGEGGFERLMQALGREYRDCTEEFLSEKFSLDGCRVLILGSFCTGDENVRERMRKRAGQIAKWVRRGGLLLQLAQTDQAEAELEWLPKGLKATRCDTDYPTPVIISPEHALFRTPNEMGEVRLAGWAYTRRGAMWETFSDQDGFQILAAQAKDHSFPSILEGAHGNGRYFLCSVPVEGAYTRGEDEETKRRALLFAENLFAHFDAVLAGTAAPVRPTSPYEPPQTPARGIVFEDSNGNGTRDGGERGVRGVVVTDGHSVVRTRKNGEYKLSVNCESARFLYITKPVGYAVPGKFYLPISPQVDVSIAADFSLRRAAPVGDEFAFVQVTDTHIVDAEDEREFIADIGAINSLNAPPAFVAATGDLVQRGANVPEFDFYLRASKRLRWPCHHVLGNHDLGGESFNTENYERFLGPINYSFNYGRWHFIVLPVRPAWDSLQEWLEADVAARPKGSHIVVFQHYAPVRGLLDFLARYDCRAVIHGHWHSTRIFNYKGITTFSTATLRFGGIDTTPGGFRIVTLRANSGLRTEYRYRGLDRFLRIAAPGEGARVPRGPVQIAGSAYDTSHGVDLVTYRIAGSTGSRAAAGDLLRTSKLGWMGEADMAAAATGEYKVTLRASARAAGEWEDAHNFVLVDEDASQVRLGSGWPMFRGDGGRTGVARDVLHPPLRLAWARSTGGVLNLSSPIVAEGCTYVSVQDLDTPDAARAGVIAFSATDGGTRWHYRTDSSVEHSPAYGDGKIFAVSIVGTVYAIDAATGAERWTHKLSGPVERWVCSAPLYADGVVYVGHGPTFAALDARTGKELWRAEPFGRDWIPPDSSPSIDGALVFLTPQRLPTRALSTRTGDIVWTFTAKEIAEQAKLSAPKLCCPVRDGVLYASYGLGFYALDAQTGELRWKAAARRGFSSPAVTADAIYIGTTSGKVLCLNRGDGAVRWEFATGPEIMCTVPYQRSAPNVASSPAVSGSVVYVGANDGKLYALSARDGTELWRYDIGTPICSSPAISGNALYIGAMDGNVYCFVRGT